MRFPFWDSKFSGAMLVSGKVYTSKVKVKFGQLFKRRVTILPFRCWFQNLLTIFNPTFVEMTLEMIIDYAILMNICMSNGLIPTPSHEVSMQIRLVNLLIRRSKDVGWISLIHAVDGSEILLTTQRVYRLQSKLVVNSRIAEWFPRQRSMNSEDSSWSNFLFKSSRSWKVFNSRKACWNGNKMSSLHLFDPMGCPDLAAGWSISWTATHWTLLPRSFVLVGVGVGVAVGPIWRQL